MSVALQRLVPSPSSSSRPQGTSSRARASSRSEPKLDVGICHCLHDTKIAIYPTDSHPKPTAHALSRTLGLPISPHCVRNSKRFAHINTWKFHRTPTCSVSSMRATCATKSLAAWQGVTAEHSTNPFITSLSLQLTFTVTFSPGLALFTLTNRRASNGRGTNRVHMQHCETSSACTLHSCSLVYTIRSAVSCKCSTALESILELSRRAMRLQLYSTPLFTSIAVLLMKPDSPCDSTSPIKCLVKRQNSDEACTAFTDQTNTTKLQCKKPRTQKHGLKTERQHTQPSCTARRRSLPLLIDVDHVYLRHLCRRHETNLSSLRQRALGYDTDATIYYGTVPPTALV